MMMDKGKVQRDWELSSLMLIYKGKGNPVECGLYKVIKLLEHGMKVLGRVFERRLREKESIGLDSCPGKGQLVQYSYYGTCKRSFWQKGHCFLYFRPREDIG